ncbi:MAG: MMPL family transporter [Brevibacillus sp.]|nr:MMPL family transporter [Brevibacillus sp.]
MWTAVLVVFLPFALSLSGQVKESGFIDKKGESYQAQMLLQNKLKHPKSQLILLYESSRLSSHNPAFLREIEQSLLPLQHHPAVQAITLPEGKMISENGKRAIVLLHLRMDDEEAQQFIPELKRKLSSSSFAISVTGTPAVDRDISLASQHDLQRAELIGIPLAFLVLLLAFRSVTAALVPILVSLVSVGVALGVLFLVNRLYTLSVFTLNLTTMLGLAIGIDYALLMVNRFREELAGRKSLTEAIAVTNRTAGKSIFFSGLTVIAGLSGLFLFDLMIFSSAAIDGIVVTAISVLAGITLVPAVLGIIGHRIDALTVRKRRSFAGWYNFAAAVMQRPVLVAAVSVYFIAALASPIRDFQVGVLDSNAIPSGYESRDALTVLEEQFDIREIYPIEITVKSQSSLLRDEGKTALLELVDRISSIDGVARVDSFVTSPLAFPASAQFTKLHVIASADPTSEEAAEIVDRIRSLPGEAGLSFYVGGKTAAEYDFLQKIKQAAPLAIAMIAILTLVILYFTFQSLVLAVKAIVMNLFSIAASFGIMVWIFQYGHGAGWLDFTPVAFTDAILPVFIFTVVFGLSMDYEVFLISRMKEIYQRTRDNARSTMEGLALTGSMITSAALIMVVITGSFAFTGVLPVKQIGVGIATAILLDATVIRLLLVPCLMKLMGRWNWSTIIRFSR